MSKRILLTYATKAGSTAEIAQFIGSNLRENGLEVDVYPVKQVESLDGYDGVVIGSAIRTANVLPQVKQFVTQHRDQLKSLPLAYFIVCATLYQDTPENRKTVADYLKPLRAIVEPQHIGLFAGKVDHSKLEQPWRFLMSFTKEAPMSGGDWRNWDSIGAWTDELAPLLKDEPVTLIKA